MVFDQETAYFLFSSKEINDGGTGLIVKWRNAS